MTTRGYYDRKPEHDAKKNHFQRVCLNCREEFPSRHRYNRLCHRCTAYAATLGDG